MKNFIISLSLIIFSLQVYSQNAEIDSLENLLANHPKTDTVKIDLLIEIAKKSRSFDLGKALQYATHADSLSDVLNFKKGKSKSLQLIGNYYFYTQELSEALEYYKQELEISEKIENKNEI